MSLQDFKLGKGDLNKIVEVKGMPKGVWGHTLPEIFFSPTNALKLNCEAFWIYFYAFQSTTSMKILD